MRIPNEKELALWENTRDILTRWKGAPPKEKELCDAVNPEHRGEYYDLIQAWMSEGRLALSSKEGIGPVSYTHLQRLAAVVLDPDILSFAVNAVQLQPCQG